VIFRDIIYRIAGTIKRNKILLFAVVDKT